MQLETWSRREARKRAARYVRLACACLLGAAVVALLLALGAAGAVGTLPFLGSFGGPGEGAGQFKVPRGVAVDGSTGPSKGDVYVADQNNQRVEKFSSAGTFDLSFGSPGTGAGEFSRPMGVAVDPSSGDVYVVDFSNHRVQKFGPQGEFLLAFGKGVNASTLGNVCTSGSGCQAGKEGTGEYEFQWEKPAPAIGNFISVGTDGTVYVGDENRIQEFEPTGVSKGQVSLPSAGKTTSLAVDASGDLYVVSTALSGVRKYNGKGEKLAEFDAGATSSQLTGVAVRPGSGDVAVLDASHGLRVREYTSAGTLSAESGEGLLQQSTGVAVSSGGTVYAVNSSGGQYAEHVLLFGEPPTEGNPAPAIDAETVSEVGEENATLEAQINPYFVEPTTYRVQYVTAAAYKPGSPNPYEGGGEAPSPPGEKLGGGKVLGDQPASVTVPGLSPGTEYHYRFVAESKAGPPTDGSDQTFTTFKPGGLAGLPDARAYEQVSSQQKNGNEAGIELNASASPVAAYATAVPGGDRVAYAQAGPSGQTSSGTDLYSVSNRTATGWETSSVVPPEYLANGDFLGQEPLAFLPSADLSRFLFVATGPFTKENSLTLGDENLGLYRTRGNTVEPEWLSRPAFPSFSEAKAEPGTIGIEGIYPVGGSSPNLSTVYFTYFGTLVGEDASRSPLVEPPPWSAATEYKTGDVVEEAGRHYKSLCCLPGETKVNKGHQPSKLEGWWEVTSAGTNTNGPWGFYEWKEGALHSAGVLPGANSPYPNQPDPYGAVPAVTGKSLGGTERDPFPRFLLNEVSQDGSKAFFVSPEPAHAAEAGTPTELYVREQTAGGPRTVLVSRDEGGMPAAGSPEAEAETAVTPFRTKWAPDAYVYASPDGSRAFFVSRDVLAKSATGTSPEGSGPWTYEFNLNTEKVTYLPGVEGSIVTSSQDGSSFIFKNTTTRKIELWSGGPGPVEIGSYSTPAEPEIEGAATRGPTAGDTVFVFDTNAVVEHAPAFNNSAALAQSYRYDVASQTLACVSCAPAGAPQRPVEANSQAHPRMVADEGRRVFFGTTAKLLSRDTNGVADVYEWEQVGEGSCHTEEREGGCVYLISSGTSRDPSFYLENDESGDNVFFSTKEGLVKGDSDESYDVYDARVNGGFPEVVPPTECASACRRGSGAPPLASPLTTALGPSGNLITHPTSTTPPPPPKPKPKPLTRAQKLAKALRACRHRPKKQRTACVRRARAQYASKSAAHGHHRSRK
jgi:hypothetical protein